MLKAEISDKAIKMRARAIEWKPQDEAAKKEEVVVDKNTDDE